MMTNKRHAVAGFLIVFALLSFVPPAFADGPGDVDDLQDLPDILNDALFDSNGDGQGENLVASQMIMVTGLAVAILVPMAIAKVDQTGIAVMMMLVLSLTTAIGWLPAYTLLVIGLLIAVLWGKKVAGWMTGGGE